MTSLFFKKKFSAPKQLSTFRNFQSSEAQHIALNLRGAGTERSEGKADRQVQARVIYFFKYGVTVRSSGFSNGGNLIVPVHAYLIPGERGSCQSAYF